VCCQHILSRTRCNRMRAHRSNKRNLWLIQIIAKDLTVPVSLSSFTGSSLVPYTCGSYQLSGQYGASDYLQKLYQTSLPHFLLILRFNVAFMGTWGTSDALVISVDGTSTNFNYNCTYSTRECTATDCIRIP
jgi:hypothetical protein